MIKFTIPLTPVTKKNSSRIIKRRQDTIPDLEKLIERVLISVNPTPELFELISAIQEAL